MKMNGIHNYQNLTSDTSFNSLNFGLRGDRNSSDAHAYQYDAMKLPDNKYDWVNGSQQFVMMFQFLTDMANDQNRSKYSLPVMFSSLLSLDISVTSEENAKTAFSLFSLWFVLILNPVVILFGVVGNLLATYILIRCNIAKLPVSFYTIMLNISDTLNLLIPVFIFWLDNCINRIPQQVYFRDRSNFLCKALMCPDQLFTTLSAWYMCAISFNRWHSVCRPSSYFFRNSAATTAAMTTAVMTTTNLSGATRGTNSISMNGTNHRQSTRSSNNVASPSALCTIPFCLPFHYCSCLTRNMKFRQHLQAFRNIACMTIVGILCCLYPIFMHELRPFTRNGTLILNYVENLADEIVPIVKRCYISEKYSMAYDVIGIILTCLLHIMPLTFVAAMNLMIIIRLKQRQTRMSVSTSLLQSQKLMKKAKSLTSIQRRISSPVNSSIQKISYYKRRTGASLQQPSTASRKDQSTSTDLPIPTFRLPSQFSKAVGSPRTPRRHHSRDRTITIMLVSVALSYLILTFPYRLLWLYNVYTKHVNPEKAKSHDYLLTMHNIDHVLRTIRNIHYGTNFVFFIFLSKTFRRKFRQIFIERLFQTINRLLRRSSATTNINHLSSSRCGHQRQANTQYQRARSSRATIGDHIIGLESISRSMFEETPSVFAEVRLPEDDDVLATVGVEHTNL